MSVGLNIFGKDLLRCMDDCIAIMEDMIDDLRDQDIINHDIHDIREMEIIINDLSKAKELVRAFDQKTLNEVFQVFLRCARPHKHRIEAKQRSFFQNVEKCTYCTNQNEIENSPCKCDTICDEKVKCVCKEDCPCCSEILTGLDSKTFTAIKRIMIKGSEEDANLMFSYMKGFLMAGERE